MKILKKDEAAHLLGISPNTVVKYSKQCLECVITDRLDISKGLVVDVDILAAWMIETKPALYKHMTYITQQSGTYYTNDTACDTSDTVYDTPPDPKNEAKQADPELSNGFVVIRDSFKEERRKNDALEKRVVIANQETQTATKRVGRSMIANAIQAAAIVGLVVAGGFIITRWNYDKETAKAQAAENINRAAQVAQTHSAAIVGKDATIGALRANNNSTAAALKDVTHFARQIAAENEQLRQQAAQPWAAMALPSIKTTAPLIVVAE